MKHSALQRAIELLEGRDVIVSYSAGKDSMIVMDIARRVAARVDAFFMELVPGLRVVEDQIDWAEQRWGVKIRRYPHWLRAKFLNEGVYCFHGTTPALSINDIYQVARADSGLRYIVTGAKKGDSLWRRRTGVLKFAKEDLKAPLWDWSSRDVSAYLKARKLPIPDSDGRSASGIDLSHECVTWLHDHHLDDYEKLLAQYPFAGAIIERRRLFEQSGAS